MGQLVERNGFWTDPESGAAYSPVSVSRHFTKRPWFFLLPDEEVRSILLIGVAHGAVVELYNRIFGIVSQHDLLIKPETKWTLVDPAGGENVIPMRGADYVASYRGPGFDFVIVDGWEGHKACAEFFTKEFSDDLAKITSSFVINMDDRQSYGPMNFTSWLRSAESVIGKNRVVRYSRVT